jgi:hypothetical protein
MIGEIAGAVDIAKAPAAEAGIGAAIAKTVVTKARTASGKAAAVEPAAADATSTVKAAATAESATATKRDGVLGPDR